jgi:hypothetical protein
MPQRSSQFASWYKSAVKVSKLRTGSASRSAPTTTWITVGLISIPAASLRTTTGLTPG